MPIDGAAQLVPGIVFAEVILVERVEGADAVLQGAAKLLAEAEFRVAENDSGSQAWSQDHFGVEAVAIVVNSLYGQDALIADVAHN